MRLALRCALPVLSLVVAASCGSDGGSGVIPAESIALTTSGSATLAIGQSVTVYVHASDANGTRIPGFAGVNWTSSVPTVASVTKTDTSATVTGLAVGETVIRATVRDGVAAQVTVRVGSVPVIGISPTAAVFTGYRGLSVPPQSITITNAGAGALTSLTATSSVPWLQASFVDGVTTANPTATLRLQPSVGTLADGSHNATVTVASSTAGVLPRSIPVTFQVSAGPVAFRIVAVTPPTQSGSAGKPVAQAPAVIVRAVDDTPVPGVAVTFSVAGGGSIAPTGVITTNGEGIAALTSWTLGTQPGASQTVTASSPGLAGSPLTFTATALAASKIAKVSGDGQTAVIGRTLPQPLIVTVSDPNDVPVPNATVTFNANSAGSTTPSTATTDGNGRATVSWKLGTAIGAQTTIATLVGPQGSPSVTFSATATGATGIVKVSGDGQSAFAGAQLPEPLKVRVIGANDEPVIGVLVTFNANGTALPETATTDANGEATTRWTLPPSTGGKLLTASINTADGARSVSFSASALTPPAAGIAIVSGDNQTGRAGAALGQQVVLRVVTTIGTGVAGSAITITPATGSGQSFSPASGTTDANGDFRTTWTLGGTLGPYTATVSSGSLPSRTITATATQLPVNQGAVSGSATKVPSGSAPTAGEQPVVSYSGPASGQVAMSGGTFTTPAIPTGTYAISVGSGNGSFRTTTVYGVSVVGGQTTALGTIPLANNGDGSIQQAIHACTNMGDANGSAVVRLYNGVNGDQGGTLTRQWTQVFGVNRVELNIPYGIYTMTITAVHNSNPGITCQVHRQQINHSFALNGGSSILPLLFLNNP